MINGFKLKFTSTELRAHLQARAKHHEDRANTKEVELGPLREIVERVKAPIEAPEAAAGKYNNSGAHGDVSVAVSSMEDQVRDHRNKAVVFRLFADHLFAEDYDLSESDLVRLEMLKR